MFGAMSGVIGLTIHMTNLGDDINQWYFAICACFLRSNSFLVKTFL